MPLEPRNREAYRLCQPMHVLSFVEGRNGVFFVCAGEPAGHRNGAGLSPGGIQADVVAVTNIKSCDHMFYLAPSRRTTSAIA